MALAEKEHPVNMYVGNLAFSVTEQDLRDLFAPYGVVGGENHLLLMCNPHEC
jgi:RNA recognition motif-containing protein